ncbi:MAG: FHA domain-containing protein [Chloroflexi bacterium]|nr:FHA domain-containing protein [Chloroflexota bacterium]
MLFHVTIGHKSKDCPGRRPTEPPALVAPSDTRETLGNELNVKLHFVLWGAACMLWAQPEHLAFAVIEAEDVESALQYVTALVPEDWTSSVLPVWNLPSQLRLIRQVRLATPTQFGEGLPPAETAKAQSNKSEAPAKQRAKPEVKIEEPVDRIEESPGTITRLLRELDSPSLEPAAASPANASALTPGPAADAPRTQIIEPIQPLPDSTATVWLVASAGPTKGRTFKVASEGATIGRLPEHEVYIPDERLSREHARVDFKDGRYWLQDLGSMNGTALNGTLVTEHQALQSGDTIELGSTKLVVTVNPTQPA